jgi:hypothetical protein
MTFYVCPENCILNRKIEAETMEEAVLNYCKVLGVSRLFDLGVESVMVTGAMDGVQFAKGFNLNLKPAPTGKEEA